MVRGSPPDALVEGKRFRRDHGTIMTGKWRERPAMILGSPSTDPSVLSFQIRLVEEDFDEGGNDLGIKRIEEPLKISRVTSAFVFSEKSGEE